MRNLRDLSFFLAIVLVTLCIALPLDVKAFIESFLNIKYINPKWLDPARIDAFECFFNLVSAVSTYLLDGHTSHVQIWRLELKSTHGLTGLRQVSLVSRWDRGVD